jgi:hypothetical protein
MASTRGSRCWRHGGSEAYIWQPLTKHGKMNTDQTTLPEPAPAPDQTTMGGCQQEPCSAWLCNKCGHKFTDPEAESVEVSPDSEECVIACPKCWANVLDDGPGALSWPND